MATNRRSPGAFSIGTASTATIQLTVGFYIFQRSLWVSTQTESFHHFFIEGSSVQTKNGLICNLEWFSGYWSHLRISAKKFVSSVDTFLVAG